MKSATAFVSIGSLSCSTWFGYRIQPVSHQMHHHQFHHRYLYQCPTSGQVSATSCNLQALSKHCDSCTYLIKSCCSCRTCSGDSSSSSALLLVMYSFAALHCKIASDARAVVGQCCMPSLSVVGIRCSCDASMTSTRLSLDYGCNGCTVAVSWSNKLSACHNLRHLKWRVNVSLLTVHHARGWLYHML